MKQIPLNTYKKRSPKIFCLVDDSFFEELSKFNWISVKTGNNIYAARWEYGADGKNRLVSMHRCILNTPKGSLTDHKDGNGLNNQLSNLRIANASQNAANIKSQKGSSSRYLGIYWDGKRSKWFATIRKNKVSKFLGRFRDENEAALAYNKAAIELHGEFANLNKLC